MYDIECPYCGHEQNINHDDGFGCREDVTEQMTCYKCEKNFIFTTSIRFHYFAEKADCLNDGQHDFQLTKTYPREYAQMRCTVCEELQR